MDPITTAIGAALATIGAAAVKDAYAGLKALLVRKFGPDSKVAEAVEGLEAKPESEGWKTVLAEELAAAGAGEDEEIVHAARALAATVEAHGGPAVSVQQTVQGDRNVFSGTGNVSVQHRP
jgi:tRNA(Ser,Leu) C12 N-acetylase TAN1